MDTTLVQLDLRDDVRTTPQADRRLLELNVDKKSGVYSVVGYVLNSKTIANHVAVRFRLFAVLRKGQPHIFADDRITLTPPATPISSRPLILRKSRCTKSRQPCSWMVSA